MSGAEDVRAADPALGKAGRNEARKIMASWLNGVSVAALVAGLLQPMLYLAQQSRTLTLLEGWISMAFLAISALLAVAAQAVAHRLED